MTHRPRQPKSVTRPNPAYVVPESQTHALHRRRSLDEQQRTFQSTYPTPHLLRRRPPG